VVNRTDVRIDRFRRAARYEVMGLPRPDVSMLGYVRWPRSLAEADMPPELKAIDLKLMVFVAHTIDLNNPWGKQTIHWKKIREFLGGGSKFDIEASLCRLTRWWITSKTPIDMLNGGGGDASYSVLERWSAGIEGQEMVWTLQREFVGDLVDGHDGYGRVPLNVIQKLESFAAIRLYLFQQFARDAMKKPEIWEPERLAVFLGCAPGIRMDHFKKRVIEPAVAEINAAANFSLIPKYVREPNTHGRAIKSINFIISIKEAVTMRAAA
jgi:hypothetical protein